MVCCSASRLDRPFHRVGYIEVRNKLALKAIMHRKSDNSEYRNFSMEIKRRMYSDLAAHGDEEVGKRNLISLFFFPSIMVLPIDIGD